MLFVTAGRHEHSDVRADAGCPALSSRARTLQGVMWMHWQVLYLLSNCSASQEQQRPGKGPGTWRWLNADWTLPASVWSSIWLTGQALPGPAWPALRQPNARRGRELRGCCAVPYCRCRLARRVVIRLASSSRLRRSHDEAVIQCRRPLGRSLRRKIVRNVFQNHCS